MGLPAVPHRGWFLICDFDRARVHPEMGKPDRPVLVISPRSYNRRHRCVVVPFSSQIPRFLSPAMVHFPGGLYRALPLESWAVCDCIMTASYDRLEMGFWMDEPISDTDMARVEEGLHHALGIVRPLT